MSSLYSSEKFIAKTTFLDGSIGAMDRLIISQYRLNKKNSSQTNIHLLIFNNITIVP